MTPYNNDPNAVNEKYFSSHSNTRDNEEIVNIDRSEIEEVIKTMRCRKVPGADDIMVE